MQFGMDSENQPFVQGASPESWEELTCPIIFKRWMKTTDFRRAWDFCYNSHQQVLKSLALLPDQVIRVTRREYVQF